MGTSAQEVDVEGTQAVGWMYHVESSDAIVEAAGSTIHLRYGFLDPETSNTGI